MRYVTMLAARISRNPPRMYFAALLPLCKNLIMGRDAPEKLRRPDHYIMTGRNSVYGRTIRSVLWRWVGLQFLKNRGRGHQSRHSFHSFSIPQDLTFGYTALRSPRH